MDLSVKEIHRLSSDDTTFILSVNRHQLPQNKPKKKEEQINNLFSPVLVIFLHPWILANSLGILIKYIFTILRV